MTRLGLAAILLITACAPRPVVVPDEPGELRELCAYCKDFYGPECELPESCERCRR